VSNKQHYRAVSWWLKWEDLLWPDPPREDFIKRRADQAAESGVNCAVIFGVHFRWDYLPLWERVHDLIGYIARECHEREIQLFDHYSCVLTHRPRNGEERLDIWRRNRHHVPFYPSREAAADWTFNGQRLNDWRMVDVETGEPAYMTSYMCEQYCMNHPGFRESYQAYLRRLLPETGIDGLMSDDAIFYPLWRGCACTWCRKRFRDDYGHELPPTSDLSFWGNRDAEAWKDWIAMRYDTVRDFMAVTQRALPEGFPLMVCCSSSDGQNMPAVAMTYQDFIEHSNIVLLEMCASTPTLEGRWGDRVQSQLLHMGIARDKGIPCIGLGYGFFPDTAFFVWAVNKFLGADAWLSTLKMRLGLPDSAVEGLADDSELVGECYRWERDHPQLFAGEADTQAAVLFSRATRDFYAQRPRDYVDDYHATCQALMQGRIQFEVVTDIPKAQEWPVLVLSSVVCLSESERAALDAYIRDGGAVIACGPVGLRDERANELAAPWLGRYGVELRIEEPERTGSWPPYANAPSHPATVEGTVDGRRLRSDEWACPEAGDGRMTWRPERASAAAGLEEQTHQRIPETEGQIASTPQNWFVRAYRDGKRLLIHGLPEQVEVHTSDEYYNHFARQPIVDRISFPEPPSQPLCIRTATTPRRVEVHSPDFDAAANVEPQINDGVVEIPLGPVKRYFVVEIEW
jgi:hypothetical protein